MAVEIAPRIVVDERVRFGKPVIRGTRVPVELVLGKLAGGMSMEEVMREYELEREDVLAALAYAARLVAQEIARFPNELSTKRINEEIRRGLAGLGESDIMGNLIIVEPGRVRIRCPE
jgi:uncharacterized protein (DUF433 family)